MKSRLFLVARIFTVPLWIITYNFFKITFKDAYCSLPMSKLSKYIHYWHLCLILKLWKLILQFFCSSWVCKKNWSPHWYFIEKTFNSEDHAAKKLIKKCPLNKSTDFIFIFRQSAGRGTERFIRVARGHGDLNPQICLANTCFFHLD